MTGEELRIGFMPLADCAPLAVADALGMFAAEDLKVTLVREVSWANIRDKVQARLLDAAHMLGPMPLAASLGVGGELTPMLAPMALNLNGSAITVSKALAEEMRRADPEGMAAKPCTARPLARVVERRRAAGAPAPALAAVFPYSMHAYELRYWLAEAGLDPDKDIRLLFTPPPRMAARLRSGEIDGFCVGAPWNAVAEAGGTGQTLIRARDFWPGGPDKVLGVTQAFALREPEVLQALLRALLKAAAWSDRLENRSDLAEILARAEYVGEPAMLLRRSLVDSPDAIVFHRWAASFPWVSHAAWFLAQMRRWGQLGPEVDILEAAVAVYRPDLFRRAAEQAGTPAPLEDVKIEGAHAAPWVLEEASEPIAMGPDQIFDHRPFDVAEAAAYAAGFEIGRFRGA
jgi:ABC-type nitrate/sulfonate/bicarbonate transport system substrate-binding protein